MSLYALDTNTLIYYFKGLGSVADRLLERPPSEIAIPIVVAYELEVGIAKSTSPRKRRGQFDELLERVRVLPLSLAAARTTARIRRGLESAGTPIGPLDTLIAGIALHFGTTLVTHNVAEFERVDGLRLVDWA